MKQTFDPRLQKDICRLASQTGTIQTTKGRQDQLPVDFGLFKATSRQASLLDEIETLVTAKQSTK